jgi:hypothetical protein
MWRFLGALVECAESVLLPASNLMPGAQRLRAGGDDHFAGFEALGDHDGGGS